MHFDEVSMMNRVNERGKVFTQHVTKVSVEVEIMTTYGHVRGQVYVRPDQRVKDLLNSSEDRFLAVTDAAIMRNGDVRHQEAGFLAINKEHIVMVVPIDEGGPAHLNLEY